jgi:hypothetical protein
MVNLLYDITYIVPYILLDRASTFARLHAYRLNNVSQSQARIPKRGAANTFRHR